MMDTGTSTITDIHLALIVILAVAAVAAIVWGMRLKRARVAAAEQFDASQAETRDATTREQAELGDAPPPVEAPSQFQAQVQTQVQAIPVAPSLPPIADETVPGTPAEPIDPPIAADSTTNPADRPVTVLKGLGPKVASALADRGITTVEQLAALDTAGADALDADLGAFRGRMARDRWIEQARFLAAGDVRGFEAVFGRL